MLTFYIPGSEDSDEGEDNVFGITENGIIGIISWYASYWYLLALANSIFLWILSGKIESKVEPKPEANKGKPAKPESSSKPKVTVVEPKKDESDDDESEDDDESDEVIHCHALNF